MTMGQLTRVCAVLGNHEYWPFQSYKDCFAKYKKLFADLGIHFLNGLVYYIGSKNHSKFMIIGSTGYAANNSLYNASTGLYQKAINSAEEEKLTRKWQRQFKQALKKAKQDNKTLIVLTHNPPRDWLDSSINISNCMLFCGHDHRNTWDRNESHNYYLFANNQIGYDGTAIKFKKAYLYSFYNPYAPYKDGYYKTNEQEYLAFCHYIGEYIEGTKQIHKTLGDDGMMWVIKHNTYYGFFLTTCKGTYICNGGSIRKIAGHPKIKRLYELFQPMLFQYLRRLQPFRDTQEQYSKLVKSFGGKGTIHGTIIDIDFENHIMINPLDGTVTFYNSPDYGILKRYNSLPQLLHHHCPQLEKKYKKVNKISTHNMTSNEIEDITGYENIDIKNSPYWMSIKVAPLQRLFGIKVLRDWDMLLLKQKIDQDYKLIE